MNRVFLLGRLTADAQLKPLENWDLVTFRVAYNERWRKGNEWVEEAHFFDVDFFTKNSEYYMEKLTKGSLILLEGRLRQERWEDGEGNKRSRVKILAERIKVLSVKSDELNPEDIDF